MSGLLGVGEGCLSRAGLAPEEAAYGKRSHKDWKCRVDKLGFLRGVILPLRVLETLGLSL